MEEYVLVPYLDNKKIVSVLLVCSLILFQSAISVNADVLGIPTDQETASGSVEYESNHFYYSWLNSSSLVDMLLINPQLPTGLPPVIQPVMLLHLTLENDSEVYVANSLIGIEIYNDLNHNHMLDADYEKSNTEVMYLLYLNASQGLQIYEPVKINDSAYTWSITFLEPQVVGNSDPAYSGTNLGVLDLTFSYLSLNYTYVMKHNSTNNKSQDVIKTSIYIGSLTKAVKQTFSGAENIIIPDSWGLSLDFGISISRTTYNLTYSWENGQVQYVNIGSGNATYFSAFLNENYTYIENNTLKEYYVYSSYAENKSLSPELKSLLSYESPSQKFINSFVKAISGADTNIDLSITNSVFGYRIEYPIWKGLEIHHDPIFIVNDVAIPNSPMPPSNVSTNSMLLLYMIPIIGIVIAIIIYEKIRQK